MHVNRPNPLGSWKNSDSRRDRQFGPQTEENEKQSLVIVAVRSPRLKPEHTHRDAVLAALPDKQQPLAREVLQNGVPGLRQTVKAHESAGSGGEASANQ